MWSRTILTLLGLWLMASPYIFPEGEARLAFNTWHGLLLFSLSALSALRKFEKMAILVFLHGVFLFLYGRFGFSHPHPPEGQNLIVVGILTAMIAIIPLRDQEPPYAEEKGMLDNV